MGDSTNKAIRASLVCLKSTRSSSNRVGDRFKRGNGEGEEVKE